MNDYNIHGCQVETCFKNADFKVSSTFLCKEHYDQNVSVGNILEDRKRDYQIIKTKTKDYE